MKESFTAQINSAVESRVKSSATTPIAHQGQVDRLFTLEEIQAMLLAYHQKKKFVKLKDNVIIEINENDASTYETRVERLYDVFDFDYIKTAKDNGDKYSTRIAFELAVKGSVQEGFMKLYQSAVELFTGRQVTYPHG